jgi:hypothetical protein
MAIIPPFRPFGLQPQLYWDIFNLGPARDLAIAGHNICYVNICHFSSSGLALREQYMSSGFWNKHANRNMPWTTAWRDVS